MPRAPSDKLIDQIYDAAIEPQLWDRVLVEIADMLSSVRGARNRYADQRLQGGFHHFGHLGIHRRAGSRPTLRFARRSVVFLEDRESLRLSGNRGLKEEAKVLQPLVPHLRRALRIRACLHGYHVLARGQQELLDLLHIGIVLIDEFNTARCVNRAAREMVATGRGLMLHNGTVSASGHSAAAELARLIAATRSSGTGGTLALQRQDSTVPLLVLACPLRGAIPEKIGRLGEPQAPVALFIEDPALGDAAQLNDMLTQFYRLTPAETRVATMFAAGFGTVGTSQHLAVSENTVKTHAKRIYEKMGLKSQGELARLLGRLATPIARRGSSPCISR